MTRLLYIAGGIAGAFAAVGGIMLLTWWLDRTFGLWGNLAQAALGAAVMGGIFGMLLYKVAGREDRRP